jgi:hypothetical protein
MAQNFVSCESFYGRSNAGPIYSGEWSARFTFAIADVTDPIVTDPIPFMPDQRPGSGYVVQVQGTIDTDAPDRAAIWAIEGYAFWNIDGVWVDNGGNQPIRAVPSQGYGRQTPAYELFFGGDAQTAIAALTGAGDLEVEVRYRAVRAASGFWQGFTTFGEFADVPPNSTTDASQFIDQWMATVGTLTGQRYLCGVNRYAEGASWSAIDCCGYVIVLPSDIGNNDNQIPVSVANNTAARFRAHPNTFLRSVGDKNRGLAVRKADPFSINLVSANQPIGIYTNDEAILTSDWLVVVDGQPSIVQLITTEQCFTPLELWNTVLSPLVQSSDSIRQVAELSGLQHLNRLSYLTYARCLTRAGTLYVQDDVDPPG